MIVSGWKQLRRAGFTLIEIMVVIVIISMVLLLVIPKLPSSEQENLKISGRTLAATIRYLEERGSTSGTGYYLSCAPGTEAFRIVELGKDGSANDPADPFLQKSPLKDGIVVSDVRIPRLGKISDGQVRVDVVVGGIRDFVTIHLRSTGGQFWTVMAFPSGGKVQNYQGYLEDPP